MRCKLENRLKNSGKSMKTQSIEQSEFGDNIALIAVRAANQYLASHGLQANPASLSACISSWLLIKLPEAIADAKEAYACGMEEIGKQTFALTIAQAGIEAAKEAGMPVNS